MLAFEDVSGDTSDLGVAERFVDEFLALGFEPVGRFRVKLDSRLSGRQLARLCSANLLRPAAVLRARDFSAFVELSRYDVSPAVRLRTRLRDGFVVETVRRWDTLSGDLRHRIIDKDMREGHEPSTTRSIEIVRDASAATLWTAHQEHVATYTYKRGSKPERHAELEAHIQASDELFSNQARRSLVSSLFSVETIMVLFYVLFALAWAIVGVVTLIKSEGFFIVGVVGLVFALAAVALNQTIGS